MMAQLMAGLFIFSLATITQAGVLKGVASGTFENAQGGDANFYKYYNNYQGKNLSWFKSGKGYACGDTPTYLAIEGRSFNIDLDTEFSFATLTYINGRNPSCGAGVPADQVDLKINLNFSDPVQMVQDFTYTLAFNAVLENSSYSEPTIETADYLYLPTEQPLAYFTHSNTKYTLQFTRFGKVDGDGGVIGLDEFHVMEGKQATANLYGKITAVEMSSAPEPGTFVLAAAGLLGLAGFMRKRRDDI